MNTQPAGGGEAAGPGAPGAAAALEDAYVEALRHLCEHTIVFNQTLGLKLHSAGPNSLRLTLAMRPELIGHPQHHRMHGGVISATLDVAGGLAVMAAIGHRHRDEPVAARMARFAKLGTIDLRVDYLRPATAAHFHAEAEVMRLGGRVASTRMGFFDANGTLLSTGTGAYIVS